MNAAAHLGNPMKGLGPPFVSWDAEPRDRRGRVDELGNLLIQCEPGDEITGSLSHGQRGFTE
uniref:Uncharacterized protein MANES_02G154700 n=1 Tax=Rhizophora mucronata TaxID=61149 RepID=A0A2P2K7Z4_RHIMU